MSNTEKAEKLVVLLVGLNYQYNSTCTVKSLYQSYWVSCILYGILFSGCNLHAILKITLRIISGHEGWLGRTTKCMMWEGGGLSEECHATHSTVCLHDNYQ